MKGRGKEWVESGRDIAVMSLAVAAAVTLLSGCGQQKSTHPVEVAQSNSAPAEATGELPALATSTPPAVPAAMSAGSTANVSNEGLPPEIALGSLDTLVTPGQPIEITVYGTPDVTEMSLSDGRGEKEPMVHDGAHDVWTAQYRVPIRPKQDRIGLSVTAKNDANRWRRVWVFLSISRPDVATASPAPATTDSSVVAK